MSKTPSTQRLRERLLLVVSPWLLAAACSSSSSSSSGGSPTSTTTGDAGTAGAGGEAGAGASGVAGTSAVAGASGVAGALPGPGGQGGEQASGASGQGGATGTGGTTSGAAGTDPAEAAGGFEGCEKGPTYPVCYAADKIAQCVPPPEAPATAWGLQPDGTMLCPPVASPDQPDAFRDCTTVCFFAIQPMPAENGECCYQMHQSNCCGRPLYVLGRALIAGLQRAAGWG